jgi:hypothetical protein
VKTFQDVLNLWREEKKKAENVLLDEIENDIEGKEKFITEQVRTLSDMQNSQNTLIEHKIVIETAA